MRLLVDVHHPAHVHFFGPFLDACAAGGHEAIVVVRDKDCTVDLLRRRGFAFEVVSRREGGLGGMAREMALRHRRLDRIVRDRRPDRMLGIAGLTITHLGRLHGIPTVALTDTDHAWLSHALFLRAAHSIVTPSCYPARHGRRQVFHRSYHELAYLHPDRFDRSRSAAVVAAAGLAPDRPRIVCRFVSWGAAHDLGHRGLDDDARRRLLAGLAAFGEVRVTAEGPLPPDLEPLRLPVATSDVHHALATAALYVGEGATMASEAVVLGTPAVYVNPLRLCYLSEQERRYGLLRHLPGGSVDDVLRAAGELLEADHRPAHARLLDEKIDLTAWMIDRFL